MASFGDCCAILRWAPLCSGVIIYYKLVPYLSQFCWPYDLAWAALPPWLNFLICKTGSQECPLPQFRRESQMEWPSE